MSLRANSSSLGFVWPRRTADAAPGHAVLGFSSWCGLELMAAALAGVDMDSDLVDLDAQMPPSAEATNMWVPGNPVPALVLKGWGPEGQHSADAAPTFMVGLLASLRMVEVMRSIGDSGSAAPGRWQCGSHWLLCRGQVHHGCGQAAIFSGMLTPSWGLPAPLTSGCGTGPGLVWALGMCSRNVPCLTRSSCGAAASLQVRDPRAPN